MRILFIHQNFPGQFGRLARRLADDPKNTVVTLGEQRKGKRFSHPGVQDYWYPKPKGAGKETHNYLRRLEGDTRRAQTVYRALRTLKDRGFTPDVVCAHPGWGETLFLKDVFPSARLLCYWEFYYNAHQGGHGFDPEFPVDENSVLKLRMTNATQLQAFADCDMGMTPTLWQKSRFPTFMQKCMVQVHDGIDTDAVRPDPDASFQVGKSGPVLTAEDEVLTYVARNLEPYRGFHSFMRALPAILEQRPECRVLVVGADGVSYGSRPPGGTTYRRMYMEETGLDSDRVHFLGRISYAEYLSVLRISSVHLYLTYPFVLSWSCLEAMSAGCVVVGSATSPVTEVIRDGENGFLIEDMLAPQCVADKVVEMLGRRRELEKIRRAARKTVVEGYDFKRVCLPRQLKLIKALAE